MSISANEINSLQDKCIINTNNEKYVLSEEFEKLFMDPEFKILGFIEKFMYVYISEYICKYTMDGRLISKLLLNVEHGTFNDNVPFMYVFSDDTVYKVSKNLYIEWSISIGDYIQSIVMDSAGSVFIITKNDRVIYKYRKDGKMMLYLNTTIDIVKDCKLYDMYISKGRNFLYVIGTQYYDNRCDTFVDKYNIAKGSLIDRTYIAHGVNVDTNNTEYEFDDIFVNGDDIYIKSINYIQKLNRKMLSSWKHMFGYNEISGNYNKLTHIEYDNISYHDYIYFCEDLYDTNGYSYGKITTNGNLLWKFTEKESDMKLDFNISVYGDYIYTYNRESLQAHIPSILALDNNTLLFETRDHHLIKIIECNKEIYNSDYYGSRELYADIINTQEPKEVYVPLAWEHGLITDEEGKYLVFKDRNKKYFIDENFIFKQLIGDLVDSAEYLKSFIKLKSGHVLKSKYGSKIKTKKPYKIPYTYDEIITKQEGDSITNIHGEDIIRKNGKPISYFNLLSDYFKFYTVLITKRKHDVLITKAKRNYLTRKTNTVYKYYLKKLKEINLVVEYLIQNNILDTAYPEYVEKLKHHTFRALEDVQKSKCPCYYDIIAYRVYEYSYDANTYDIDEKGVQIYLCKNLPFIKKKEYKPLDIRSMAEMVEDDTITPFILFIGGKAIKWSNITIVRDWHESFIIISDLENTEQENIDCILYPCAIHYGEDNRIDETSDTGLYFDEFGNCTTDADKISMRIEILDEDIVSTTQRIDKNKKYIEMNLELNHLSTENNIFVFDNGLFDSDNRYYLKNTGYNIYGYEKDTQNVIFRTFYYIKGLKSKNMIFKIPNTNNVRNDAINSIKGNTRTYLTSMNYNFDFHFSRNKSYDRNIAEAIDYISSYDISLLMNYYKKQSFFSSIVLSGRDIIKRLNSDNNIVLNRNRRFYEIDDIIVYKNGILLDEYNEISKNHKSFIIPMAGIVDSDEIEIVRYNHTNNQDYTIHVESQTDDIVIMDYINKHGFHLFENNGSSATEVDYSYINYYNSYEQYTHSNIKFKDPKYYNKNLTIIGDRQFRHQTFIGDTNNHRFELASEFKYSKVKEQYLIFVNGKKINMENWSITFSDKIIIELLNVKNIQKVDVFYIPETVDEITIPTYYDPYGIGNVDIQSTLMDVPFDNEVFYVYLDGIKIPINKVQTIDKNTFRVDGYTHELSNLCICKYIQSDQIMKHLLSYNELWSDGTQTLNNEIYNRLFKHMQS